MRGGSKGLYEPNCYTGLQLNSDDVSQLIGDVGGTGLKVWKWLREALHFLHRKQQAMPQFPKTASIFNRLWRDPVWSKVIAYAITGGIAALGGLVSSHPKSGIAYDISRQPVRA